MGLGVMFGILALGVDAGFGMVQVRAMQNGADAGALAAANLVAGSATDGGGGVVAFAVANGDVQSKAEEFAASNRPANVGLLDLPAMASLLAPPIAYAQVSTPTETPTQPPTLTPTPSRTPTPSPTTRPAGNHTLVCNPNPVMPKTSTTCTITETRAG